MDDSGPTASIIFFVLLLLTDMFFYGFTAALHSLNEKEIERRSVEEKNKKALRLKYMLDNPSGFINTSQMVIMLVNVMIGAVHLGLLVRAFMWGLSSGLGNVPYISAEVIAAAAALFATVLLLYITMTLGVLLPRRIAMRIPEKWAYAFVTPVYFVMKIFRPFTGLAGVTTNGILRLFGVKTSPDEVDVTEEEIISMINEGHEQGVIQASEAEMISNIFEFGDKEAQDIMTHRNNIVAIDGNMLLRDAISFMSEGQNSRYPVYEENLDHIIGILHLKDAMRFYADESKLYCPLRDLEGLLREPCFVPRTKNIDELFREMQAEKLQMVVVVDEYGQTDGLVAMEDILEEIVGNILDEYDEDSESFIEEKGEDTYIIEGKTPLEELEERFGISFAEEEFETLNGFLISRLDKIPEPDEEFDVDYCGYNFKILSVENKMIQSVQVTKLSEETAQTQEEGGSEESEVEQNDQK